MRFSVFLLAIALSGCLFGGDTDYEGIDDDIRQEAKGFLTPTFETNQSILRGVEFVGYHNGIDNTGDPNAIPAGGYYTELAITDKYAYIAKGSQNGDLMNDGNHGGFSIINIRDKANPTFVGSFEAPTGGDIAINEDETLAFFTTQRNSVEELVGRLQTGGPSSVLPRGIYVVDIDEPATPTLASFVPLPVNGPHTAEYYKHKNGAEYLIVSTYDLLTNPATGTIQSAFPLTQRVIVFEILSSPVISLFPVAQFQILENAPTGKLYFPHDTYVQEHPFTNETIIYVAYWDKGVRLVDFSNPPRASDPTTIVNYADPDTFQNLFNLREIEGYSEFDPSARNNIHQVRASEDLIADYHVTVAEPEIISAPETGIITFLDSSVPSDLERLGYWTLPESEAGPLTVNNLDYSPHNFDIQDGVVALAHNKAGLWFIDVSNEENLKDPKTTGYYLPNMDRTSSPKAQPYVWGAFWQDDYVFLSDESSGLHILRYTGP